MLIEKIQSRWRVREVEGSPVNRFADIAVTATEYANLHIWEISHLYRYTDSHHYY